MSTFHLQIVTPDGIFFDGQAQRIRLRGTEGDFCIMKNHTDFVTALSTGVTRIILEDGTVKEAACNGGMVSVTKDITRVIAVTFEWAESIDLQRAQAAKEQAEQNLKDATNIKEQKLAEAKLKRAMTRIHLAQD
ncbi:MAG: ATP synthase F1 subunit epsilon [Oscillospiraceae bacterium]|nr:ATP synthase F1 subunit epsilon [Oscillospiraceae bacterium]